MFVKNNEFNNLEFVIPYKGLLIYLTYDDIVEFL